MLQIKLHLHEHAKELKMLLEQHGCGLKKKRFDLFTLISNFQLTWWTCITKELMLQDKSKTYNI